MPTVLGRDGVRRPTWADRSEAARAYFDTEWGVPLRSESGLLELVVLLGFAGGLTWAAVLARRDALREAFAGYDADVVAAYDESVVQRLLHDERLIRNEHKIRAAVANARATRALREAGGLSALVWGCASDESAPTRVELTAVPRSDARSARLAADLRAAGFTRIGPVAAQALLLAAGVLEVARAEEAAEIGGIDADRHPDGRSPRRDGGGRARRRAKIGQASGSVRTGLGGDDPQ